MATIEQLNTTELSSPDASLEQLSLTENGDTIEAIQSRTARTIIAELHHEPASMGELADRIDTSLQNIDYHLQRIRNVGLVTVVGTRYSEKGREINVYAPAVTGLVIHNDNVGDENTSES